MVVLKVRKSGVIMLSGCINVWLQGMVPLNVVSEEEQTLSNLLQASSVRNLWLFWSQYYCLR